MTDSAIEREKVKAAENERKKQLFKYSVLKRPITATTRLLGGDEIVFQANDAKTVFDEMNRLNLEPHEGFQYSIFDRDLTNDYNRMMSNPASGSKKGTVRYGEG